MTQTVRIPQADMTTGPDVSEVLTLEVSPSKSRVKSVQRLRLLWSERRFLKRAAFAGFLLGILIAFLLPKRFEAMTQLMPPDNQFASGMAMRAALSGTIGGGLENIAGDLVGMKSSGALFIGILRSQTVGDRLVRRYDLKKVYRKQLDEDARRELTVNSTISEDRKSGIITILVTDNSPERATALAHAYVEELDRLASELSTSSAHRERVFLEERLTAVKHDLDLASKKFSEFSSQNTTIDIKEQGKAMVDTAGILMGQLIAAESQLKELETIYTPNNVRVRSVQARISELRKQLEKMGGKQEKGQGDAAYDDSMFPSIRKLPLLGVTYADLYRQTRIQESIYETLTKEYELAKVQEAREIPSVRVLDVARVPERKAFPPRPVIMFLCSALALVGAAVLTLGKAFWHEVDSQDPGKVFAQEVFRTLNSSMPWAPPKGSRSNARSHKTWLRLALRKDSPETAEERKNLS